MRSIPPVPRALLLAILAALLSLPTSLALAQPGDTLPLAAEHARAWRAADGGTALTPPSAAPRAEVVTAFVAARLGKAAARSLVPRSEHASKLNAVHHLRFGQRIAGLDVYGTYVKATVDGQGRMMSVVENLVALT